MNAIPPKNQLNKEARDPVRLTMDFDDEPAEATDAPHASTTQDWADAEQEADAAPASGGDAPADADSRQDPSRGAKGGRATRTAPAGPRLPAQLAGIQLVLTVEVGSVSIPLRDLLAVEPGQLLGLDSMASEPVSVLVNGKPFARGEIVAMGERFGVRLLDIVTPAGDLG